MEEGKGKRKIKSEERDMENVSNFTQLRSWGCGEDSEITLNDVKMMFQNMISVLEYKLYIIDDTADGSEVFHNSEFPVLRLCSENPAYMNIYIYKYVAEGNVIIGMSATGKGEQIAAPDLQKFYKKAWGHITTIKHDMKKVKKRFGTAEAVAYGVGGAIGCSAVLIAKGVKKLFRDTEAYEREMAFYTLAMEMGDFLIGGEDKAQYFSEVKQKAEEENPLAQYMLGLAYYAGLGTEVNKSEAVNWFEKSSLNGEASGEFPFVSEVLFSENTYDVEKKKRAAEMLVKFADSGEDWAINTLLDIYGEGSIDGIEIDLKKALGFAEKYAVGTNEKAKFFFAKACEDGIVQGGVTLQEKNAGRAAELYASLVNSEQKEYREYAAVHLADMLMNGRGIEAKPAEAIQYYEIASKSGNLYAKTELCKALTLGPDEEKDYTKAKSLCRTLLVSGDEGAAAEALYCSFIIAKDEGRVKESLNYAQQYISTPGSTDGKKQDAEKYIAEIENKMESMSEEEKKAFLKEADSASGNTKIKLIIVVVLALICAVVIFALQTDNSNVAPQDYTGNDNGFQATADKEEYVEPSINSGEEAKHYLESYLFPDGNLYPEDSMIDGIAFVDETELGYELHVYKDMGDYTTTIAWLVVTPDGRLYDEIAEEWIWEL